MQEFDAICTFGGMKLLVVCDCGGEVGMVVMGKMRRKMKLGESQQGSGYGWG